MIKIFDSLWISALPDFIIKTLPALSLVIVGYLVEKNFVGRVSTFCNTMAINLHLMLINNPNPYLIWYANLGLVMGCIGIFAYQTKSSLSTYFYYASWLYCSIIVGLLTLAVH